jgi:hypothetical protein
VSWSPYLTREPDGCRAGDYNGVLYWYDTRFIVHPAGKCSAGLQLFEVESPVIIHTVDAGSLNESVIIIQFKSYLFTGKLSQTANYKALVSRKK